MIVLEVYNNESSLTAKKGRVVLLAIPSFGRYHIDAPSHVGFDTTPVSREFSIVIFGFGFIFVEYKFL